MTSTSRYSDTVFGACRFTVLFVLVILACRFTQGYAIGAVALLGVGYAWMRKTGQALAAYLLLLFLSIINPVLFFKGAHFFFLSRLSSLALLGGLIVMGTRSHGEDHQQIPLQGLFFFLVVALISSIQGWFPLISYCKIINYLIFILGIFEGAKNLHHNPADVRVVRFSLLAISILIVFGSLATLPFPAIAYTTSLQEIIREEGIAAASEYFTLEDRTGLFCGITSQSQVLGPALACVGGWVLCDMLLVERRIVWLHGALLAAVPPMIFMTRSRAGVLAFVVMICMVLYYCLPAARLPFRTRRHIRSLMVFFLIVLAIGAITFEVRNQSISRLLRKTDDVVSDDRSFLEAITNSRQGLIRRCMDEFRRNPLLGSGFQVIEEHPELFDRGVISLFSAPIEKGILPLMVLGETGVAGFVVFSLFLLHFFVTCWRKRYSATLTLFTVFLATNMAEGTFFSPGGAGGVQFVVSILGGFVIDMNVLLVSRKKHAVLPDPHRASPEDFEGRPIHRVRLHRIEVPEELLEENAASSRPWSEREKQV